MASQSQPVVDTRDGEIVAVASLAAASVTDKHNEPLPIFIKDAHAAHQDLIIEERDKSGLKVIRRWVHHANSVVIEAPIDRTSSIGYSLRSARQILFDAFMPIGYPNSVSPDYFQYQTYDSLQAFFSTITSLLASRAILQGLGVGDASTTATYALLLTILKDAISRVATITFAYRFGLAIEPDAKRYRFLADLFNDSAFFLDLGSPYFGPWVKILALTIAEALRSLCGVAAGASKAALSSHFARSNNLAELNAKEASQETAVGLLGLFAGSILVRFVENHDTVFVLMIILVFVHLYMNYLGVRCVQLNTMNQQRATILIQHYLRTGSVMTPAEVAQHEAIIFWAPMITNMHGKVVCHLAMAKTYGDMTADFTEGNGYQIARKNFGGINYAKIFITAGRDDDAYCALKAWYEGILAAWKGQVILWDDEELMEREGFFRLAEEAGWSTSEQGLETGMPFRVWVRSVVGGEKKKQ